MNNRNRSAVLGFVSLLLPAAAVYIWRTAWWPLLLFAVWTVAAAVICVLSDRRYYRGQNARMLEHARQSAIRTLSHHRHDWMNDLQIMYGYLRLKKPDKAIEIVDRIRERMENDSRISQLRNTELSTFLLSFRTICDHMRLEFKVEDGLQPDRLPVDMEKFAAILIAIVNAVRYRAVTPAAGENVLRLTLFRSEESLSLELVFEGELAAGGSLAAEVENLLGGWGQLTQEALGKSAGTPNEPCRKMVVTFPMTA
ncbi:histidine kinase [Cohnella pontilimi]|uniref:Histidine kinase n=1 Tax=Cohnella pontilimi TaxID=2564100 RepID=A0A4U0FB80_9BACL|nr:Spo0B domain-containing protein [Cohnella pontilimi]TJY41434.1 histidine kinase [Cohnella pontilimi]